MRGLLPAAEGPGRDPGGPVAPRTGTEKRALRLVRRPPFAIFAPNST